VTGGPGIGKVLLTERRQDHEQSLSEGRGDFALVEPSDLNEVAFREVDADLLPRLTQRSVQRRLVCRLLPAARERDVAAPAGAGGRAGPTRRAADEQEFGDGARVLDPVWGVLAGISEVLYRALARE
jgi:hypothetical protein